ncbi:MAG: pyruvate kinase [Desulfobacterales bacterium]|jgi:pyruvate kinase|nr:pyruvate kinase [Desulfobacterales bacterium]
MPKTKIICTIGPASDSEEIISGMIQKGMNVARLNFSHGTHAEHARRIKMIREVSRKEKKPVAILQDLCGPKIRIGQIDPPGIRLEPGETLILTSSPTDISNNAVSITYKELPAEVSIGDVILLADGLMELTVKHKTITNIYCDVITGGVLTSGKGINLPSGTIKAKALTEKDKADLYFGIEHDVDYVALSFVRRAEDVRIVKDIIRRAGKDIPVIAKIEKHEALNNIKEIVEISDGIMVARGDLGVEIPLEKVPVIQKSLVRKANRAAKPVIIATQMLRSMVESPRPTRAEANDVANAVLDGTDAVMLSEETASGAYPVKAVEYMARIAENTEENYPYDRPLNLTLEQGVSESVSFAACILADHLKASAIIATTKSGFTAMQISRCRPKTKIVALSPDERAIRRLALYWGCLPSYVEHTDDIDVMFDIAVEYAQKTGHIAKDDLVVITSGHPLWKAGTTNMIKVRRL